MNKGSYFTTSCLIIIMAFLFVGCDYITFFEEPAPKDFPIWMGSIKDNFEDGNTLQIELDIAEVWEIGDDDIDVSLAIQESLQISLNNQLVPDKDIIILGGAFAITEVHDDDGNFLGSYREEFFIYIDVSSHPDFEFVTIEFQSSAGKEFEYTWKYR